MLSFSFGTNTSIAMRSSNSTVPRPAEACGKDYEQVRVTSQYPAPTSTSTSWWWGTSTGPSTAEQACQEYLTTREALSQRVGKLCVVTGVSSTKCPAFCVAQELALTAGMHVVLAGRANLATCQQAIQEEAKVRQVKTKLYATKFHLASLQSIRQAAGFVKRLAKSKYNNQCQLLVNMAHVGTSQARLTVDGLEYNTGCNFVGTLYFTKLLLPLLEQAPCSRVVHASSMGHCLGANFSPQRLIEYPAEGGAPPGFLQQSTREHCVRTSLLMPDEIIQVNQEEAAFTPAQHQQAVQKRGTQVGRSKMALMAATYHLSRVHTNILFFTFHLLPPSQSWFGGNQEAAALPALRAALDDQFRNGDTDDSSGGGCCYYLHADGNPWTPMAPAQDEVFGKDCFEAGDRVLDQLLPLAAERLINATQDGMSYEPPQLEA